MWLTYDSLRFSILIINNFRTCATVHICAKKTTFAKNYRNIWSHVELEENEQNTKIKCAIDLMVFEIGYIECKANMCIAKI